MIACKLRRRGAAFTIVELLAGMGIFGLFAAGMLTMWSTIGYSALNTTSFSRRQNDQMRVLDYVKRDIRRATKIELYNGSTLVTDTTTFATELRLTIADFYADSREEDDTLAPKVTNPPTASGASVVYGAPLTVRYLTIGGAGIRREGTISRTVSDSAGAFAFSFKRETSGAIRCRVLFEQPMRGGNPRTIRRQVETVCLPRFELQL